jgi:hypothetical protein
VSDSTAYKDENLSKGGHQDPDLHWMGETLPSPSIQELAVSGTDDNVGTSKFPARADHSHDTRQINSIYSVTNKSLPGASAITYVNTWVYLGDADLNHVDILNGGSTQLFVFPQEGRWEIHMRYAIVRSTGTMPQNMPYDLQFHYNGATQNRRVKRLPIGSTPVTSVFQDTVTDIIDVIPGFSYDVQFQMTNFDSVAWNFSAVTYFTRYGTLRQSVV